MKYYFAPMEGLNDMTYRRIHCKYYPGADKYFSPFVSPTQNHFFTPRELREIGMENNKGIPFVPQLLCKNSEDMLWALGALADMGYEEVNLNLGCPSGTVFGKGKGSGMLADPGELNAFLDAVYARTPVKLSIKTRIGVESPDEFSLLMKIFEQYPISELIIHPRTREEYYTGAIHRDVFAAATETSGLPLCYNGDLFTVADCRRLETEYPKLNAMMMGRGLAADPAMITKLRGGCGDKKTLYAFHHELCEAYPVVFECDRNAMMRMKAIWRYLLPRFRNWETYRRSLEKTKRYGDFLAVTEDIFQNLELISVSE